jgi:hypothetical protein
MPYSAKAMRSDNWTPLQSSFDMGELWRVGLWGMAAAAALLVAVFASSTERGNERLIQTLSRGHGSIERSAAGSRRAFDEKEGRRLADAVKLLTIDRDGMLARIATLETNVRTAADSINRMEKVVQAAHAPPWMPSLESGAPAAVSSPVPPPDMTATTPAPEASVATPPPSEEITSVIPPIEEPIPLPIPKGLRGTPPAPAEVISEALPEIPEAKPVETRLEHPETMVRTRFGLDIGTAKTLEGLRALWKAAQRRHAMQLEGLRPIVHVRELSRPGGIQLRLVAGPIPTAAIAARLCAAMVADGGLCEPALFDGQRLALR